MFSAVSYQEQMAQIATDVFRSMLRMDVVSCNKPALLTSDVAAVVRFEGAWNGALVIQCSLVQACEFASRFMRINRPTWFDENARDALGEVANMIGGNLKALLPPKTTLSIPEVFSVAPTSAWFINAEASSAISLRNETGVFCITLLEQRFSDCHCVTIPNSL